MKNIVLIIISLALLFTLCSKKYPIDLGRGYNIDYDGNSYFYLLDKKNTVIVGSHITNFKFDSIFIVIEQKPVDSILKGTYNDSEMDLKKRDRLFEESTFLQYWIINKKSENEYRGYVGSGNDMRAVYSNVYGPFKKDEYMQKREELKVPKELVLKEE